MKKKIYEQKLMEREGSKEEKRNEECFKGEGGNSSDQDEKKRIKDHEKEAKRDTERSRKKGRGKKSGEISFISVPQEITDICCQLCRGE